LFTAIFSIICDLQKIQNRENTLLKLTCRPLRQVADIFGQIGWYLHGCLSSRGPITSALH